MINNQGGLNGRKLNLISLDDGFSPPKTVEQTRRLVEEEQVAFIYGSIGDITLSRSGNISTTTKSRSCSLGVLPTSSTILANILGHSAATPRAPARRTSTRNTSRRGKPNAKIGVLYNNNHFGKNVVKAIGDWLGPDRASMLVSEVSFQEGEPTVDSQMITLQASGAACAALGILRQGMSS